MSIDSVTTSSVLLVSLAMVALLASGWRKPARPKLEAARVPTDGTPRGLSRVSAVPYRPAPPWRRVWSIVAGSGLAVITGALIATMLGFGAAYLVIELSRLLRQ